MRTKTLLFIYGALATTLCAQVRPRIALPADDSRLVRIPGTTHSQATPANDAGRAPADLPMDRILLQLKSTPQQAAALEQLLVEQQDPQSANFHRWLTPEEFGEQFGAAPEDLDVIAKWLEGHGFRIGEISKGRRSIEFSGTAQQVETAFHTEIHYYLVDGARHVANATDLAIPEALAEVVGGVASMHDFHARPLHHVIQPNPAPQTDLTGGTHALSPYDFAAIYDLTPLWNNKWDGSGQTIAVVADTNVNLNDAATFRSQYGLGANNVTVVLNGPNPGIVSGEEGEADLDMEWSGGVAKGAAVNLVVSGNTNSSDGITLSSQYIVNHNLAAVMSLSYGLCEADLGSGNAFFNNLWSQAAAQGISVLVSAGDSGSAGCDAPQSTGSKGKNTTSPASGGFGVNGLASTPYNLAVGGTMFTDTAANWSTTNAANGSSALGYINETVWNESSYSASSTANNGLWAGSGGFSTLYPTPAWQTGSGVPTVDPAGAGHHRYLPDVSLSGAGHDGYLVYIEGKLNMVAGTSASVQAMAGIMAILVQKAGSRQGNPNLALYPIARNSPGAFHDIATGTNAVPCLGGSPNCSSRTVGTPGVLNGFNAGPGFDLATGWGSVDANALATAWGSTPPSLTIVSLSPNPMAGKSTAQPLTINGSAFAGNAAVTLKCPANPSATASVTSSSSTQIQASVNVGAVAETCTVQVGSSNIVNLTVTLPPAISSISPTTMTGSNSNQLLTIAGAGFQSGLKVVLTSGTQTVAETGNSIASFSNTVLKVNVNVGTAAKNWGVQVVNPDGSSSNSATLTVTAPLAAPAISSLSPSPMTGSAGAQTLTIKGSGFQSGVKVLMQPTNSNLVTTYPATSFSPTQIGAQVNVGTARRYWYVQLQNPDGQYSNWVLLQVN